jgi:hypothetical protein
MKKMIVTLLLSSTLTLSACQTSGDGQTTNWGSLAQDVLNSQLFQSTAMSALSSSEISAGLREALNMGTSAVVSQLGQSGGFNLDPLIRIALPKELETVDNALSKLGMDGLTKDLKNRMNAAAEIATPRAKELFVNAITNMTITDAQNILGGANDAATQYLRQSMGTQLAGDISPIIQNALSQAGAMQAYDQVMGQYQSLPFMPDVKSDLNDYVVDKALDGIFYYVAQEEAAIRENPAKRTTELLKKVFGQ